jgi:3-isopropylmalate dehydratase small subunit
VLLQETTIVIRTSIADILNNCFKLGLLFIVTHF